MKNKITIRQGSEKDVDSIVELFQKQSPEHWSQDPKVFWKWRNEKLSHKKTLISLAEYSNKIIGYYCIEPKKINFFGEIIEVGFGMHAVVDPLYRKELSIMQVTEFAYDLAKESQMKFIYGFPNNNFYLIQEKIERWDRVSIFNSMEVKTIESLDCNFFISPLVEKDFDEFEFPRIKEETICLENSKEYFKNRFFNHPRSLYKCFSIKEKQSDENLGFLVLKIYNSKTGHIIDFVKTDKVGNSDIIKLSNNFFSDKQIELISFWQINNNFKKAILSTYNKTKEGFKTNFYVKFLDSEFKNKNSEKILDINNWSLPMGISDAF